MSGFLFYLNFLILLIFSRFCLVCSLFSDILSLPGKVVVWYSLQTLHLYQPRTPILFSALICESTASIVVNFNLLLHVSCIFLMKSFLLVDLLFAIAKNQFLRLQNQQSFFLVGEQSINENLCSLCALLLQILCDSGRY